MLKSICLILVMVGLAFSATQGPTFTPSNSISLTNSLTITGTISVSSPVTKTASGSGSLTLTNTITNTLSNSITATLSNTLSTSISNTLSTSYSASNGANFQRVPIDAKSIHQCFAGKDYYCIEWSNPADPATGLITPYDYYNIKFGVLGTDPTKRFVNPVTGRTFEVLVDLQPNTQYVLQIQGFILSDGRLAAPYSTEVTFRTAVDRFKGIYNFNCVRKKKQAMCTFLQGSNTFDKLTVELTCPKDAGVIKGKTPTSGFGPSTNQIFLDRAPSRNQQCVAQVRADYPNVVKVKKNKGKKQTTGVKGFDTRINF